MAIWAPMMSMMTATVDHHRAAIQYVKVGVVVSVAWGILLHVHPLIAYALWRSICAVGANDAVAVSTVTSARNRCWAATAAAVAVGPALFAGFAISVALFLGLVRSRRIV